MLPRNGVWPERTLAAGERVSKSLSAEGLRVVWRIGGRRGSQWHGNCGGYPSEAGSQLRVGVNPGLGVGGYGLLNINGGTTTVSGNLRFTDNGTDSDGTLNLNDGTLTVVTGSSIITDAGTGTINLNKTGVLNVVDGNIKATNLNVGVTASAAYTQTAGLVDVNKLTLGNGAFAGTYNVDGGTLKANHIEDLGITLTGEHSGMFTYEIVDIAGGRQALRLTSHVPEPATLTMLALGGLGLLIRRRRS